MMMALLTLSIIVYGVNWKSKGVKLIVNEKRTFLKLDYSSVRWCQVEVS
jgi:hypothetical protein